MKIRVLFFSLLTIFSSLSFAGGGYRKVCGKPSGPISVMRRDASGGVISGVGVGITSGSKPMITAFSMDEQIGARLQSAAHESVICVEGQVNISPYGEAMIDVMYVEVPQN